MQSCSTAARTRRLGPHRQGSGLLMMVIEQLGNDPLWSASVDQSQNPLGLFSQLLGALEYPIERASEVVYPNL